MRRIAGCVLAALALTPAATAAAADPPPDPGTLTEGHVTADGSDYRYLLYTPSTYDPSRPAPLLVDVHGCQTTAEGEMGGSEFNKLAEKEGFIVLYADVDAVGRALPGPLKNCWKFFSPAPYTRDTSDPEAIVNMTRQVMIDREIDAERVYLVGSSAGGLMSSILTATYPEIYAAVALVVTAGYLDAPCFTTGIGIPVELSAQLAFLQMGHRKRVVPRMAIGSTGDLAFPAFCTEKAVEQGLRTTNLALSGSQTSPLSLKPASTTSERVPGGRAWTRSLFRDPDGCLVGERWIIQGMPHGWPGGTSDPRYNTDHTSPDATAGTWNFLKRYRRSDTEMPCAEAPPEPAAPASTVPRTCSKRAVTLTLPRGKRVRGVRAMAAGKRVKVSRTGRRVRVTLPAGKPKKLRVTLTVRREGRARAQVLRRTVTRRCG